MGYVSNDRPAGATSDRVCLLPNHPTLGFDAPPKKETQLGELHIDIPFDDQTQPLCSWRRVSSTVSPSTGRHALDDPIRDSAAHKRSRYASVSE